jgi:hypothetical protein
MRIEQTLCGAACALFLFPAAVLAQVDCADANNLCTGNPCVVGEIEVVSPCVVDFGARTLVLTRTLKVPNAGVLSFSAQDIEVSGKVLGRHTVVTAGDGAAVSLIASNSIQVLKRIDVSGRFSAGSVVLDAGGSVVLRAPISAAAKGNSPTAAGGTVTMVAQGSLTSTHRGRIKAKGKNTPGGSVSLSAATVGLDSSIDVSGSLGGVALVAGSVSAVILGDKVAARGADAVGGTITISGPSEVTTEGKLDADGESTGGVIDVSGGAVDVRGNAQARGNGSGGNGGVISIAGQTVSLRNVRLRGRSNAGVLSASASAGDLTVAGQIDSRAVNGIGGDTSLLASGGVVVLRRVRSDGQTAGGSIDIESTGAFVTVEDRLNVDASAGAGGTVAIAAATDIILDGGADAGGAPGGAIVASAADDLLASGRFDAQVGGCIALTAGGTLNLTDASLDPANSASCP